MALLESLLALPLPFLSSRLTAALGPLALAGTLQRLAPRLVGTHVDVLATDVRLALGLFRGWLLAIGFALAVLLGLLGVLIGLGRFRLVGAGLGLRGCRLDLGLGLGRRWRRLVLVPAASSAEQPGGAEHRHRHHQREKAAACWCWRYDSHVRPSVEQHPGSRPQWRRGSGLEVLTWPPGQGRVAPRAVERGR
jgi:hypothetical protein